MVRFRKGCFRRFENWSGRDEVVVNFELAVVLERDRVGLEDFDRVGFC
jgi:hypothetical protein